MLCTSTQHFHIRHQIIWHISDNEVACIGIFDSIWTVLCIINILSFEGDQSSIDCNKQNIYIYIYMFLVFNWDGLIIHCHVIRYETDDAYNSELHMIAETKTKISQSLPGTAGGRTIKKLKFIQWWRSMDMRATRGQTLGTKFELRNLTLSFIFFNYY